MMKLTPVDSKLVKAVHFDAKTNVLTVQLVYGERTHNGVPVALFEMLMTADSIGSFYSNSIKNQYPFNPNVGESVAPND